MWLPGRKQANAAYNLITGATMKSTYLVTYDLHTPGQDYPQVHLAIKKKFPSAQKLLESVWIIESSSPASVIHDVIRMDIDGNDDLIVCKISEIYPRHFAH
ncbi:hypothetical protein DA2_3181 [Desulfovibrio sp. A2]|nr:hypothetical protein DA2_3181 [Desulfovibrio sp. A2]